MADDSDRPIIIKRVKKGGHGHHGGAWKVAYADFVTAMMAFFLLMWLLNVSTSEQKEGIADYFTPTYGIKDEKGADTKGGKSPMEEGTSKSDVTPPGIVVGQTPQGPISQVPKKDAEVEQNADSKMFQAAEENIKKTFEEDPNFRDFKDNIIVEQNPEGLKIELTDSDKYPMFEPGGVQLSAFGEKLLAKSAEVILKMPNRISITGHTDAMNYAREEKYTNWELSADRANAARRYLMTKKLEQTRVYKVVGNADQVLLVPDQPSSPRNRRVTIILLRGSYLELSNDVQSAPRGLLTVPKPTDTIKTPEAAPVAPPKKVEEKPAEVPQETAPAEVPVPPATMKVPKPRGANPGIGTLPSGMFERTPEE